MSLSQRQIQQNVSAATGNKSCVSAHQSFHRDLQDREADLGVKLNRVNLSFVSHSAHCPPILVYLLPRLTTVGC